MYRRHRYNLIRFDLSTADTAYKLFVKSINDYVIVKEVTVSNVTVRTYFIAYKNLETNWSNRASLTYSVDIQDKKLVNEGQNWLLAAGRDAFTGLLDLYKNAAAAYSLTRLSKDYKGAAIEVRRDSDNSVQDIGFVNGILDTAALTTFCTTPVNIYTSDFANSEQFSEFNGTGYFNQSIGGRTGVYKYENDATASFHQFLLGVLQENTNVTVSFDYYIPSTNTDIDSIKLVNGGTLDTLYGLDQWISYTNTFDAQHNRFRFFTAINGYDSNILAPNDVVYIDNLTFTQNTSNGYVPIWYDQSSLGNNAVQNTASKQPKIFDGINGVILENGKPALLFENAQVLRNDFGSGSTLEKSLIFVANEYSTSNIFAPVVDSYDETPDERIFTGRNNLDFMTIGATITNGFATYANTQILSFTNIDGTGNVVWNIDSNQVATGITTTGYNGISLGAIRIRSSLYYMRGTIQEVIYYLNDQSSNRAAIEDNINNRYNIY